MIGFRELSVYVGVFAVTCIWTGAQAFADPGDIWGMISGQVDVVSSACTGDPGATETGTTNDSIIGTHGVSDQYWAAYGASCGTASYNVTCGSNVDEQEVVDFSMSSTTSDDASGVDYDAEYELLHETGGSSTTTVHVTYHFTSQGDSHSLSELNVRKNGTTVLSFNVSTDEVSVKDGAGNVLDSFDPQQPYFNHNFSYKKSFPITLSTGDRLRLTGNTWVEATEGGSDLSTLDVDVSTIGPT
ncbi:hypothetical protein [Gimesia aquarii]|uniref:Uncharacterized protein n=1 Tax=Gimesia aquarii TaxID=2527964 RepID=A0A517WXP8_9PLAN|nr:hypothetical protein [Gimesia aquarii]QDU10027.1 hypothetical protein V202x_34240 [Gimesia aquarii]